MSFFEFPHSRTYDSDLGYIIKKMGQFEESLEQSQEYAENAKTSAEESAASADEAAASATLAGQHANAAARSATQATQNAQAVVDNLQEQFDAAINAVTTDTEVINIRTGAQVLGSTQYTTAGEAVRGQVTELYNQAETLREQMYPYIGEDYAKNDWERGGWNQIINWDEPRPLDNWIRIRKEVITNDGKPIYIKRTNPDYEYTYAAFDSYGQLIQGTLLWQTADHFIDATNIYALRIAIRHSDNTEILAEEGNVSGITAYTIGAFDELQESFDKYFGINYTDRNAWAQGGYGEITNYAEPNPNESAIRIKTEFEVDSVSTITIHRQNTGYQYIYAVFDAAGALIVGTRLWQSSDRTINAANMKYVRISIRRDNDSEIAPIDYHSSGIFATSPGTINNLSGALSFKLMNFNLGHFSYGVEPYYLNANYTQKLNNYKKFFSRQKCDVLMLQENNTYLDGLNDGNIDANSALYSYLYPYASDVTPNGTSIKSKLSFTSSGTGSFAATGRSYSWAITAGVQEIYLLSVHLTPNAGADQDDLRAREAQEIINLMNQHEYAICGGDFNAQTLGFYDIFKNAGYKVSNGGYLPAEFTYSYSPSDYSAATPSDNVRYFDNLITSSNIIIDDTEVVNTYADLSSDHIPLITYVTLV